MYKRQGQTVRRTVSAAEPPVPAKPGEAVLEVEHFAVPSKLHKMCIRDRVVRRSALQRSGDKNVSQTPFKPICVQYGFRFFVTEKSERCV